MKATRQIALKHDFSYDLIYVFSGSTSNVLPQCWDSPIFENVWYVNQQWEGRNVTIASTNVTNIVVYGRKDNARTSPVCCCWRVWKLSWGYPMSLAV